MSQKLLKTKFFYTVLRRLQNEEAMSEAAQAGFVRVHPRGVQRENPYTEQNKVDQAQGGQGAAGGEKIPQKGNRQGEVPPAEAARPRRKIPQAESAAAPLRREAVLVRGEGAGGGRGQQRAPEQEEGGERGRGWRGEGGSDGQGDAEGAGDGHQDLLHVLPGLPEGGGTRDNDDPPARFFVNYKKFS